MKTKKTSTVSKTENKEVTGVENNNPAVANLNSNANQGLKNKKNKSCCNFSKDMYSQSFG